MALSREIIEQRYRGKLEAAEEWREVNPERYAEDRQKAVEERADAYSTMAEESERTARSATLDGAKAQALVKYPLAAPMARFITGDTAEAIEQAAKDIHDSVTAQNADALQAANAARRPITRQQWTGSPTGTRPGMPGGELTQPDSALTEQVNRTYNRTAEIIAEAGKPGTFRRFSDEAMAVLRAPDAEAQALADHQVLTPNTGFSSRAMKARSEGKTVYEGDVTAEDRRG